MAKRKRGITALLALGVLALGYAFAPSAPRLDADPSARARGIDAGDDRQWQAVAPGRVEPSSGEIKMRASLVGEITDVTVKSNDTVFAGEPIVRLADREARARVASARAQLALRKRARNEQPASGQAAEWRRTEDAAADAERGVDDAQAALDRVATEWRAGRRPNADLATARKALARAQDGLAQRQAALQRMESAANAPLPSPAEGEYAVARAELMAASAALDKLTIRAPLDGTVLEVNARVGETASPSTTEPLVVLGDISRKRVRAEVDERDYGTIKVGQPAVIRAAAFPGRDFEGKVASIAPIAKQGQIGSPGQRELTDVEIVNVLVDLTDATPLAVGMKVDVYFRPDAPPPPR